MMKIKLIIAIVCILGTFGMSGVELSQLKEEGLVNPKGVECTPPDHRGGRGPEGLSLYHYWYTTLLECITGILGEGADEAFYKRLAGEIKESFNKRYFNYEECAYYFSGKLGGYRQASQVLPLYVAMEPGGYGQRIADKLAEDIVKHDNHFADYHYRSAAGEYKA